MEDLTRADRVVVTGGAGFIGSHLVEAVMQYADTVLVIDNLSTGSEDNLPEDFNVDLETADISSALAHSEIVDFRPQVIYHLAAQTDVPTSVKHPLDDAETNVLGTLNVLHAAEMIGAKVVFASTGGALYGSLTGGQKAFSEFDPVHPHSPYAISKMCAERYVELESRDHCILRYANVYGPGQSAKAEGGVVAIFDKCLRDGEPVIVYGDGRQTRDFVHVDDVVRATHAAANFKGVMNVGTGVETSIISLLRTLAKLHHVDPIVVDAPERVGDVRHTALDSELLSNHLHWEPRSLPDGLHELVGATR